MSEAQYQPVANTSDVPQGKTLCITIDGREILICHTAEGYYAVDNLCTHAAERLSEGKLKGCRILCPLHGAAFDVRDGAALSKPAKVALTTYPLLIDGESISIQIS